MFRMGVRFHCFEIYLCHNCVDVSMQGCSWEIATELRRPFFDCWSWIMYFVQETVRFRITKTKKIKPLFNVSFVSFRVVVLSCYCGKNTQRWSLSSPRTAGYTNLLHWSFFLLGNGVLHWMIQWLCWRNYWLLVSLSRFLLQLVMIWCTDVIS